MRILLDARLYGLENAGLGRYAINLISNLAKIDAKNEYLILLRKKYYETLILPKNWQKILADFAHYSITEQIKLPPLLVRYRTDIVHFLHFNVPIFYRGKYVVTIHDLLMQEHRGRQATTLPPHIYYSKFLAAKLTFKSAVNRAVKIIVPSNAVKNQLAQKYKLKAERIRPIYLGVDQKFFGESKGAVFQKYSLRKPYFLYVGNAYPHKNLAAAISAMGTLFKQSGKVTLAISCSRSAFTQKLADLIKTMGAEKYVKFLGFVPDEDLPGLYKDAVGFVYPSLSEGFGLQGLEAMAAQTLVVASDIPVFREIYRQHALYFDPKDVNSIILTLKNALEMEVSLREVRVLRAGEFVKRYSWRTMAEQTLKIYKQSLQDLPVTAK